MKTAISPAASARIEVRDLMRRTKQEKEFADWIETVRIKHKAKRNFMQRLDLMPTNVDVNRRTT